MEVNDTAKDVVSSRSSISIKPTDDTGKLTTEQAAVTHSTDRILYTLEETPPWYLCAFLSFQVGSF